MNGPDAQDDALLRAKINLETAQIPWRDLQTHFAAGNVLQVGSDIDLVEVAFQMSKDNRKQVTLWMATGELQQVPDSQAQAWYDDEAQLWAVVVRPFVLVQQRD